MISKLVKEKINEYYVLRNLYNQQVITISKDETIVDLEMNTIKTMYNNMHKEVISLACSEQVIQGNRYNPILFATGQYPSKINGGFDLDKSILGRNFWSNIIYERKYYLAISIYNAGLEILKEETS